MEKKLTHTLSMTKSTGNNSTFAIGAVSCSAESFDVAVSSVLHINICAEMPTHRKCANRYAKYQQTKQPS